MLHKKFNQNKQEGFTIIEVLIVLAIAALILLIVFLAVPALQRTARNTSRKSEASRVATAFANYATNNNGTLAGLETVSTWTADCKATLSDVGTLSQYSGISGNATPCTAATANGATDAVTNNEIDEYTPALTNTITASAAGQKDGMVYVTGVQCSGMSGGGSNTMTINTLGTSRQSSLVYTLESSSGFVLACNAVT